MSQWIRVLSLTVSGIRISDLRIEFHVHKTMDRVNNVATFRVFNLTKEHRDKIKEEHDNVTLYGGYRDGNQGLIFTGEVTSVTNTLEGVDIVTVINAHEAETAASYGFVNMTVEQEQTAPFDIIRLINKSMTGIDMGETVGVKGLPKKDRPLIVCGGVVDEMDRVCRDNKLHWSVQNGKLDVVADDKAIIVDTLISQETGMIGSPEPTELGVRVKSLLNYQIVPKRTIDVHTIITGLSGRFMVDVVTFIGNNMDGEFICDIQAIRMKGATVHKHPKFRTDIV